MARSVTAHMFYAVNGVAESPHLFQFDAFGPEEGELMGAALDGVTDVIMGRKLWEEWKDYWATAGADDPFAQFINPVRKHVVSSTLSAGDDGELGWNSIVVHGDPAEYVSVLASGDGGRITVAGGIDTVRSLFLAGAVDTLTLTVHPAVTGEGRRLFDESVDLTRLRLVEGRTTSSGNAVLTYALREG
jgi:dihydrofolate reductase